VRRRRRGFPYPLILIRSKRLSVITERPAPIPFHSRSRRISAIAVASPSLCRTIRRSSSSRPIATVIPLFKYHRETARPASLFFQMGFMLRHNGTEISIRSTNIISDYTGANGVALRWPPRLHIKLQCVVPDTRRSQICNWYLSRKSIASEFPVTLDRSVFNREKNLVGTIGENVKMEHF